MKEGKANLTAAKLFYCAVFLIIYTQTEKLITSFI